MKVAPMPRKSRVRNWEVRQLNHRTPLPPVRTFDLAPLQGASRLVNDSQG